MSGTYRAITEVEEGQGVRYRLVACRCGAEGRLRDRTRQGMPGEMVERAFRRQGWARVKPAGGVCPECQRRKAAKPETIKEPPMAAEPPRQPTPDDKRRIREELFAHYLEDQGCWSGAHSDRSVAEALNVPFAWVSQMRDALGFGPDVSEAATAWNAEIQALRAELTATADRLLSEAAKTMDALAERLAGRGAPGDDRRPVSDPRLPEPSSGGSWRPDRGLVQGR
ncbi:hypothetical protein [uncultured Brevundimonas sp.]|uniref:hypothetical protein n=1 Tax=uncultured Brevundimonas sp. TaxID=213418 RepID=UPI00260EF227|nr:hypothetical protein [uncultured Brevundimonas sp.]